MVKPGSPDPRPWLFPLYKLLSAEQSIAKDILDIKEDVCGDFKGFYLPKFHSVGGFLRNQCSDPMRYTCLGVNEQGPQGLHVPPSVPGVVQEPPRGGVWSQVEGRVSRSG